MCLGHAIVDRLAHVEAATVVASGVEPESMTLVNGEQIGRIVELVGTWVQVAGGSAANTAAGLASLGGRPAFVGSVGADELGARSTATSTRPGSAASSARTALVFPPGSAWCSSRPTRFARWPPTSAPGLR